MLATDSTIPAEQDRDERRVRAAVVEDVLDELLAVLAAQEAGDPREAAEAGEPEQRGEREEAERRDRAEQVQPATPADEVRALRLRSEEVDREVEQEDHADRVVVDRDELPRAVVQREEGQDHQGEREDGQDQDEDVVGVAVLAERRCGDSHGQRVLLEIRPGRGWRPS